MKTLPRSGLTGYGSACVKNFSLFWIEMWQKKKALLERRITGCRHDNQVLKGEHNLWEMSRHDVTVPVYSTFKNQEMKKRERERGSFKLAVILSKTTRTHHRSPRPSVYTRSCWVILFCWYSKIESKAVPNLAFLWQEIPCGCGCIFAYECVWQTVSEIVPITLSSTLNCSAPSLKWSLTFGSVAVRAKAFHCLWPYDLAATFMK